MSNDPLDLLVLLYKNRDLGDSPEVRHRQGRGRNTAPCKEAQNAARRAVYERPKRL